MAGFWADAKERATVAASRARTAVGEKYTSWQAKRAAKRGLREALAAITVADGPEIAARIQAALDSADPSVTPAYKDKQRTAVETRVQDETGALFERCLLARAEEIATRADLDRVRKGCRAELDDRGLTAWLREQDVRDASTAVTAPLRLAAHHRALSVLSAGLTTEVLRSRSWAAVFAEADAAGGEWLDAADAHEVAVEAAIRRELRSERVDDAALAEFDDLRGAIGLGPLVDDDDLFATVIGDRARARLLPPTFDEFPLLITPAATIPIGAGVTLGVASMNLYRWDEEAGEFRWVGVGLLGIGTDAVVAGTKDSLRDWDLFALPTSSIVDVTMVGTEIVVTTLDEERWRIDAMSRPKIVHALVQAATSWGGG
jgi:hypothetical protein